MNKKSLENNTDLESIIKKVVEESEKEKIENCTIFCDAIVPIIKKILEREDITNVSSVLLSKMAMHLYFTCDIYDYVYEYIDEIFHQEDTINEFKLK